MAQPSDLDLFLKDVMHISVLRMGGAGAGIVGSSGAEADIVNNLKKTVLDFANESRKPTIDQVALQQLSDEVRGLLQTLGVLSILSAERTNQLIHELRAIVDQLMASPQ